MTPKRLSTQALGLSTQALGLSTQALGLFSDAGHHMCVVQGFSSKATAAISCHPRFQAHGFIFQSQAASRHGVSCSRAATKSTCKYDVRPFGDAGIPRMITASWPAGRQVGQDGHLGENLKLSL